jgi:hypothetical protein
LWLEGDVLCVRKDLFFEVIDIAMKD